MTAAKKIAVDFEEIIKKDREDRARQQHQALAQQILGKGRHSSGPGAGLGLRKQDTGPSLASRVGISKRSASHGVQNSTVTKQSQPRPAVKPEGNVNADWTHDLHDSTSPAVSRGGQLKTRAARGGHPDREVRLYKALNGSASSPALSNQFNIVGNTKSSTGISIRGLAGPSIVMAENFAPGTTAADIESAMTPIGGRILKCSLVTSASTVIAELVFETREGADSVIEQFHNQTADGRVLTLYHKPGPVPAKLLTTLPEHTAAVPPLGPRADISDSSRSATRYAASDRYEPRDRSREKTRSYDRNDVVDGSYGFEERMDIDDSEYNHDDRGKGRGLYSDNLISRKDDRSDIGRGWRDSRQRGRGGDRGRDRGHGYR